MFYKNCPECNTIIEYKIKSSYVASIRLNSKCKKCGYSETARKNLKTKPSKYCVICDALLDRKAQGTTCTKKCANELILKTKEIRYGTKGYNNRNKAAETLSNKYGKNIINVSQITDVKTKVTNAGRYYTRINVSGSNNPMFGKTQTEETKRKIRIKVVERLKIKKHYPGFNKIACDIIEQYGKSNGYNFQHALNIGEYCIKQLGYFVDGYDKEKNIVIEYDETHHFKNGKLKTKDIKRQDQIIKYLNCLFIRIRYDGNITILNNK